MDNRGQGMLETYNDMGKDTSTVLNLFKELYEGFRIQIKGDNDNSYGANNARKVLQHFDSNKNKVLHTLNKYADWGLSYADKDFYILVRGGEVQMPLDYKAYARIAVQNARLAGFDLILEAGVVRDGYKKGYILKGENGDENFIIANPMIGRILFPWAKYKLLSSKTHEVVSSMVEVVPEDEYKKAMSKGGGNSENSVGQIHQNYATEGAKKIALRRVVKHISYMFPHMRELEIADNEQYDFDEPINQQPQKQHDPLTAHNNEQRQQQPKKLNIDNA